MKLALASISLIALAILAFCAARFDTHTTLVIAIAMALVAFFSGSAVALGVITRRAESRRKNPPHADAAEIIPNHDVTPRAP